MARRIRRAALRFLFLTGLVAAAGLSNPVPAEAGDSYAFDEGHTKIFFFYNHLGLSTQSGRFNDFTGTLLFDQEEPANSSIEVTIEVESIDTGVPALDDVLMSDEFFDVDNYPKITFKSTSVSQTGMKSAHVTGELTIKDNTKPVVLDVTLVFADEHPLSALVDHYKSAHYATFSARTEILRSDFGVGLYAPLTSDEIEIVIEAEFRRQ
jgi:polyisoprenoid-binding protein YceI